MRVSSKLGRLRRITIVTVTSTIELLKQSYEKNFQTSQKRWLLCSADGAIVGRS